MQELETNNVFVDYINFDRKKTKEEKKAMESNMPIPYEPNNTQPLENIDIKLRFDL